jgi:hypothetical protein
LVLRIGWGRRPVSVSLSELGCTPKLVCFLTGWWGGGRRAEFPFRGNPATFLTVSEPRRLSVSRNCLAGVTLSAASGTRPGTRVVRMTAPESPGPYRRPRRAGAFRGSILLRPSSIAGAKLRCWEWRGHTPQGELTPSRARESYGIFARPTEPSACQRRTGPNRGSRPIRASGFFSPSTRFSITRTGAHSRSGELVLPEIVEADRQA